jgi:hypothetical protein
MRKIVIPVITLVALMSMSFTSNKRSIEIVNTENGSYMKNVDLLSLDDLGTLTFMSMKGPKTTKVIHTKVILKLINKTVTSSTDLAFTSAEQLKLDEILSKY